MEELLNLTLHADELIGDLLDQYGDLTYLLLFGIIFIETGLVVVAFFPGDGLLISAGILAAVGDLDLFVLLLLLTLATFLGNTSNYLIGRWFGTRFIRKDKLLKRSYIAKADAYYKKYGGAAVVLSRFFPFLRTLVPFVAGIARMNVLPFSWCNGLGGIMWISTYLLIGYFLGEIPWVNSNYGLVLAVLLVLLVAGMLLAVLKSLLKRSE